MATKENEVINIEAPASLPTTLTINPIDPIKHDLMLDERADRAYEIVNIAVFEREYDTRASADFMSAYRNGTLTEEKWANVSKIFGNKLSKEEIETMLDERRDDIIKLITFTAEETWPDDPAILHQMLVHIANMQTYRTLYLVELVKFYSDLSYGLKGDCALDGAHYRVQAIKRKFGPEKIAKTDDENMSHWYAGEVLGVLPEGQPKTWEDKENT